LQKHAGKLHNFHVTADNTKVDSHHYDIVRNEIDLKVFDDKLSPAENLQATLVRQEGSELIYSKAKAAIYEKKFAQAAAYYSQILAMIPGEAKHKSSWYAIGKTFDRVAYTMRAHRQRALCYSEMGDNVRALADLTEAIRLVPDDAYTYMKRAEAYYLLGKKALGDADTKTEQALFAAQSRLHPSPN
jgi:tetratricopeptide (TPR) repeat protein